MLLFSFPASAEWTLVATSNTASRFYVDFSRIKNAEGYVYFWELSDFTKGVIAGKSYKSAVAYTQADCKVFRKKWLVVNWYNMEMGKGVIEFTQSGDDKWNYPGPRSSSELILKSVCG